MNATDKAQFAAEDNFLVEQLRLENWWLREALRKLAGARNPVAPLGGGRRVRLAAGASAPGSRRGEKGARQF